MCKNKKRNNDNTPIRSVQTFDQDTLRSKKPSARTLSPSQYASASLNHSEIRELIQEVLKEEFTNFATKINQNLSGTINTELRLIKEDKRFQRSIFFS